VASRGERYGPDASAHPAASSAPNVLQHCCYTARTALSMCCGIEIAGQAHEAESTGDGKPKTRHLIEIELGLRTKPERRPPMENEKKRAGH